MKRLQLYNATYLVEWEDTPEGLKEAKMFRFCHPDFKHKRIRHVLRLDPLELPLRRIVNRWTGKDAVDDGSYKYEPHSAGSLQSFFDAARAAFA